MDSHLVMIVLKWALLILLWVFIFLALKTMASTIKAASPVVNATPAGGRYFSQIVVIDGPQAGMTIDATGVDSIALGRAQDCEVVIDDNFASWKHARLFNTVGGWFIEDLASRNGTQVNGETIEEPEKVTAGTEITIGRTTVRLVP